MLSYNNNVGPISMSLYPKDLCNFTMRQKSNWNPKTTTCEKYANNTA